MPRIIGEERRALKVRSLGDDYGTVATTGDGRIVE
jgi:hypothetical protein